MSSIRSDFKDSGVPERTKALLSKSVLPEIERLRSVKDYHDPHASLCLPDDTNLREYVSELAHKYRKMQAIVLVGIGGSNLGTMAIQEAVLPRQNQLRTPKIYYAETVDAKGMNDLLEQIMPLIKKKKVLINVVSKSGTTAETIACFSILMRALKGKPSDHIVISTDEGSALEVYAHQNNFPTVDIPKSVGGRYSALSGAGLFPLRFLGVDIEALHFGAREMRDLCLSDPTDNPAIQGAIALAHHHASGRNVINTFVFSPELEGFARWYRQLLAESIGKELDLSGKRRNVTGLVPLVSVGSTDLHSMAQLFLGGKDLVYHSIVSSKDRPVVTVPSLNDLAKLVPGVEGHALADLMDSARDGFTSALHLKNRPFSTIELDDTSERTMGALLELKMIETMYLGFLLNVNPFDQPNVEDYKKEMRRILSS